MNPSPESAEAPPLSGTEASHEEGAELIAQASRHWWSGECGVREVMALALPLVVSTMSWTVMNFVDRMFLLWHSQEEMAAAAPAGFLLFTFMCFPLGVAAYANTFVAQYEGAGTRRRIGLVVWQAVWVALLATPLFVGSVPLARAVYQYAGHPETVQAYEVSYYRILSMAAGAALCSAALSSFFTGRGKTRIVMIVDVVAMLMNIVLNYAMVFGHFGFSEMGIVGAAWATVLSTWTKAFLFFWLVLRRRYESEFGIRSQIRVDWRLLGRLFYFGAPEGLRMLVEMSAVTGFLLLLGGLGEAALAATTLAFNINSVGFIPLVGMGIAVSTMVGQQLGRNRPELASRATWTAFLVSLAYTTFMAVLYLGFPGLLLAAHAHGVSQQSFEELQRTTTMLLRYVAAYCMMDTVYIIFLSAIKGAGDTRFVLVATIILAPLPTFGTWAGLRFFGWGLGECWALLTCWITLNGVLYGGRYWQGKWRSMRVIEPEFA